MMSNINLSSSTNPLVSRKKIELKKAFQSAKSIDKQLKLFQKLEKIFDESELGFECWFLANELAAKGRSSEQVISFGNRALQIFISNDNTNTPSLGKVFSRFSVRIGSNGIPCLQFHKSSLYIAYICNLLASACSELERYNECLSYLNWANRNLSKLEEDDDSSCSNNCLLSTSLITQRELIQIKVEMGRIEEVVIHLRKELDIKERTMKKGCVQLGDSYEFVCGTYLQLMNYKEALPFLLKALKIYTKHYGRNSRQVIVLMRNLVVTYIELGEYGKALEQNQLLQNMLNLDRTTLLALESDHGDILIGLGKCEQAIEVLRRVVSHTDTMEETRASAYFTMARSFCCLEKFAEAEKYLRTGLQYSRNMEQDINVAVRYRNMCSMSRLYEKKDDFENAISLLGKALIISDIPRNILAEGSARLFSLISLSCKEDKGIPYMEAVVEKLKERFGEKDCEVAHGYRNLGAAYLKAGQEELAIKFVVKAKEIMDVALGPHHLDSLKTSHALAETYATITRYDLALEIQEKVLEGLKVLEHCEQEFLDIAVKLLNKMKDKVAKYPASASPQSIDDADLSERISKCGI